MRILLVTWTDQLLKKMSFLSPELEYCAIVVDDTEPAKKILEQVGLSQDLLYPLYDLKECVKNLYYDYILCVDNSWMTNFLDVVQEYDVPKHKILGINLLADNFFMERSLRYFKEHAAKYEMFATGMSYAEVGLDVTKFGRKLFNFSRSSQDLYYNFQTAKFAVSYGKNLRYAFLELAPYKFHYDLSRSYNLQFLMLHYLLAFKDLHNFHIPAEMYQKFFSKDYLERRLSLEPFDVNNPFNMKKPLCFMTPQTRFEIIRKKDGGGGKNFPETREENIKILDDYLTLCEKNNIRPIIFLPPMSEGYIKFYNKQRIDEFRYLVNQSCRKHSSAIFLDGWKLQIVNDADFYDYGHLNIQGAAKLSVFLNYFIEGLETRGW